MNQNRDVSAAAFVEAAFTYLNTIAGGDVCSDRSCIRCRIADVAFEVELRECTKDASS